MTQVRGLVQCLMQGKPSVSSRAFVTLPLPQNLLGEGLGGFWEWGAEWGRSPVGFGIAVGEPRALRRRPGPSAVGRQWGSSSYPRGG